jgi:hypothetical protein
MKIKRALDPEHAANLEVSKSDIYPGRLWVSVGRGYAEGGQGWQDALLTPAQAMRLAGQLSKWAFKQTRRKARNTPAVRRGSDNRKRKGNG